MDLIITCGLLAASLGLIALFGWLGARPPNIARGPRLLPYRMLMLLSAAAVIVIVTHLVNLLGVNTGQNTR
ncbi:MAG: hypothetical protein ACHP7N_13265 [Caulobacterales bacterium]